MSDSVLPVHAVRSAFVDELRDGGVVVLSAPTGSGKSTQIPQWLMAMSGDDPDNGRVVVLQPRRIAARMLAGRVGQELGSRTGDLVGYQIRFENRSSRATKILFVTEAILLRQALEDSALAGVSAVVFDEFHERNLHADLALAAVRRIQASGRSDLRVVVMSATLDKRTVEHWLPEAQFLEAGGRQYPIQVQYTGSALGHRAAPVWERALEALKRAKAADVLEGHVLIFMPGIYEINRTLRLLDGAPAARGYALHALHGSLPPREQDAAVAAGGPPRIIVSTNVAETSLTIEGVRVVIDGGLARISRYDSGRGVNRLMVEPISRASAEQRAGRAGRTGPGVVYRLWSEAEHAARPGEDTPEVHRVDLAEAALLLTDAGLDPFGESSWFEAPEKARVEQAMELLRQLKVVDAQDRLTEPGRKIARLPVHPRIGRMLVQAGAEPEGATALAAAAAALFDQRPIYQRGAPGADLRRQEREVENELAGESDLLTQLRALGLAAEANFERAACKQLGIHAVAARQVWQGCLQITELVARSGLGQRESPGSLVHALTNPSEQARSGFSRALLSAFSDHLALRLDRATRRARMLDGRVGELRRESMVNGPLWIACEREERALRGEVGILLGQAHPVEMEQVQAAFPEDFTDFEGVRYDSETRRVVVERELRFRELVLERREAGEVSEAGARSKAAAILAGEVAAGRLALKQWNVAVDQWIARVNFLASHCPETGIEPIDAEATLLLLEQLCEGAVSYREIKDRPVLPVFQRWIAPEQHYYLDTWAPDSLSLPRRKRPVPVRYSEDGRATIAATVQDLYDVPGERLSVGNGRIRLLIEILAPNRKMVQLTEDLDGFWERAYPAVRKDLAGRYPKHEWR